MPERPIAPPATPPWWMDSWLPPAPKERQYVNPNAPIDDPSRFRHPYEASARTFMDQLSGRLYENMVRPLASPMGVGMTLAGLPPATRPALAAIGTGLGMGSSYNAAKEGDYPAAIMGAGFSALGGGYLGQRALAQRGPRAPQPPVPEGPIDPSRRKLMIGAGAAAGGAALMGKLPKGLLSTSKAKAGGAPNNWILDSLDVETPAPGMYRVSAEYSTPKGRVSVYRNFHAEDGPLPSDAELGATFGPNQQVKFTKIPEGFPGEVSKFWENPHQDKTVPRPSRASSDFEWSSPGTVDYPYNAVRHTDPRFLTQFDKAGNAKLNRNPWEAAARPIKKEGYYPQYTELTHPEYMDLLRQLNQSMGTSRTTPTVSPRSRRDFLSRTKGK